MTFDSFGLRPEILRALEALHHKTPTPIQEQSIPPVLEGKDLLGCAQTGTGKTAAFALPILQRLSGASGGSRGPRGIRCLVLTPTRELCSQVADSFAAYGRHAGLRVGAVYGGVSQRPQEQALKKGIDILVATPGRLLDLLSQGLLSIGSVEVLVLDEADRMLDMGFLPDVRRIIGRTPPVRQTLMFSATIPYEIRRLAGSIQREPVRVSVTPEAPAAETVEHRLYYVEKPSKGDLLRHLLADGSIGNALVFTRTRIGAERLARQLARAGVAAEAIHGDRSQGQRERALEGFKKGKTRVLVATDVAARGIDIAELSHVVNFELPEEAESYVHRIGRTGRAGASGIALSFCSVPERPLVAAVEKLIGRHLEVAPENPFRSPLAPGRATEISPRPARAASNRFLIPAEKLFQGA